MKKELVIILPISIIIITATVLCILYFCTNIFKSGEQLFWGYIIKNSGILNTFENENEKEQQQVKKVNNYTATGTLNICVEKNEEMQNINVITNTSHEAETGRTYTKATLKNEETELLKLFYINSDDVYAIKCEELLKYYIGIRNSDLKDFARKMGVDELNIQYIPDNINFENILNITEKEKNQIIKTYLNIIVQNIQKNNYTKLGKNTIEIEENIYETKAYLLKLNGNELKDIIIKCLENSKSDNTVLDILERNGISNYTEALDNIILNIQNKEINKNLEITIYVNEEKIIRTAINILDILKLNIDNISELNNIKAIISVQTSEVISEIPYNSKIVLSKVVEENYITNNIKIMPDVSRPTYEYSLTTKMGKLQNNNIDNLTVTTVTNENNLKISATYNKNIQIGTEVEKIMELKNSNAVIVNNYTVKQLQPFIEKNIINKFDNVTKKLESIGINELTPKIILEIVGVTGSSLISSNNGKTGRILSGALIFTTDYAQKSSLITNSLPNNTNETEAQLTIKRLTSADGTRNISANDVNRVYDVVIENNSIMSEENLISINDVVEVEKLKEDKSNIDIAKTYKIQIKKYKSNGSISEIIVKENTENFNIIEETMPGTGE